MPINNFVGETFVAFIDILGFTELMKNENRALKALDRLYTSGYELLMDRDVVGQIEGLFISDSGVLFVRDVGDKVQGLRHLLSVVENLNRKMLTDDFMLTTSIAYGEFRYQERIEFVGITKNAVYGNAYTSAFFDNERGLPRIQPGQCRLLRSSMPPDLDAWLAGTDRILGRVRERAQDTKHLYFYWNVENADHIKGFEEQYQDAYDLKYKGILGALKRYSNQH